MLVPQEKGSTFVMRRICDQIQAKTAELFLSFTNQQHSKHKLMQNKNVPHNESTKLCSKTFQTQQANFMPEESFIEKVKNQLCRIISSQLPTVVNFQTRINEKIEDLEQQIEECKKQLKIEKLNYKNSILERDNLKIEILSKQNQNQQLADQSDSFKSKYNQAMLLVNTYMKEIQSLQTQIQQLQAQNAQPQQLNQNYDPQLNYFNSGPSPKSLTADITSPKSTSKQFNYPLQMRQKLNQAQMVLNRSPRPNDPQLQSSHFQLSSEIMGCQKQLLEIQLKNAEKDKAQLILQLQQERNYTKNLEKEIDNLQKLVDGEKKLNQKLDRELYTLINATKQMKIQLLEQRAKNKQLEQEVFEMQQAIGSHHKEVTQLQEKITQLQIEQRKIPKLQDQVNELRAKLQISNKKYDQLRKIKHQLEQKVQEFQAKIVEIEKKQAQDQIKQLSFQQTIKSQNTEKIKQIEEMSLMIKIKYEKKIQVMEKHYKELKDKCKYYKQQNTKLYQGFEIQSKKQAKLQDKYQKTKSKQQQLEKQLTAMKENLQQVEQKLKTQTLLSKELKREVMNSEKFKLYYERKLKKLLLSKLPNLLSEIKSMKQETNTLKSIIQTYKDITSKIGPKSLLEFQSRLFVILTEEKEKFNSLQSELHKKLTLLDHWKKQAEISEDEKVKLIQRLNSLQTKESLQAQEIEAKHAELVLLGQRFSLLEAINLKLETQIQNYRKIQKAGLQQIQILRQKQKEIEQFYSLVEQLTEQNKVLKKRLDDAVSKNQEYATFNQNQHSQNNYFQYYSQNSLKNNDQLPSYLIPQKQGKQKSNSRPGEGISNSHSCFHLQSLSKNKSSMGFVDRLKNLSFEKHQHKNHNKSQYDQTVSNQLPIHSRPIMFNSRKSHMQMDPCETFPSEEMVDLKEQKEIIKYNFENQRQRLEEIKLEYQKMMADKFRQEFIQKMTHLKFYH